MEIIPTVRRHAIPILYTFGTHYEVGFNIGATFTSIIRSFLQKSTNLNNELLPLYNSAKGKNAYNETLETVKKSFPQYVREIEGIADGAQVEFYKLFLLHMDDILPQSIKHSCTLQKRPIGCSTIILNCCNDRIIGHTEDALSETLNHFYLVGAHIVDVPEGKYMEKEENFVSLCYAGHLPGYTMSYNHHGLVFTINTLSVEFLKSGRTPRYFITRALLAARNMEQAIKILKDTGVGVGNGCSINITFLKDPSQMCYNIEIAPAADKDKETQINIQKVPHGTHYFHTNKYERIDIQESNKFMLASSKSRMKTFQSHLIPQNKAEVISMLGDTSGGTHCVFIENGCMRQMVKTIAVGVFDLNEKTWSLYSDNPRDNKPLAILPLLIKE